MLGFHIRYFFFIYWNKKFYILWFAKLGNTVRDSNTFFSTNINIIVEPDVRANIAGTSVTVSTGSGDNSLSLYDVTDLDGTDRAIARFTNTSQNADNYEYDFFDDSSSITNVAEDGSTAGTIGATLDKDYSGTSAGNVNFRFRASGTPDTIAQDDEETITFAMKSTPSAPANLSSKSLTLDDAAQGTSPKLCANFDDASGSLTSQSAGDSLDTTTARRYTSGTIDTATVTNFITNDSIGYIMPQNRSLDIDNRLDWLWGEFLLMQNYLHFYM